ncbi:hypothetical protein DOTSEDRAFT_156195 [Dothistroma septosporum NZE10]|uniref:Heterokaryon incompatibility domain-containing protein n=1 Tax=Dothistroma septosporum (strain NZE10 / CBS 128990) TaxID=675120 RepID=N1PG75_DOTSN|nr:hypothetical protein DOTSEDRAFT_156195 [Dothistroma septosporum NZE10]
MPMGQIYAHAESVAAGLGPSSDDEKLFMRHLAVSPNTIAFYSNAARVFGRRSYFDRLWVVQECFLAAKLEAYCGHDRIDWPMLLKTVCHGAVPQHVCTFMVDRGGTSNVEGGKDFPRNFAKSVLQVCGRSCGDLHDKFTICWLWRRRKYEWASQSIAKSLSWNS